MQQQHEMHIALAFRYTVSEGRLMADFSRPPCAGEVGLEIAPGFAVDKNPALDKLGNPWNTMPTAKEWIAVDPKPGCILVNIGDGLAWWSDGKFKSTYHRVRSPAATDPQASILNSGFSGWTFADEVCDPCQTCTCVIAETQLHLG